MLEKWNKGRGVEKIPYYDELLHFVTGSVHDLHEAQDIVQQTFERLLQHYSHIPPDKQRSLLYEVARNLLIDRHRQQQRQLHESDAILATLPAAEHCQPEVIYAQREQWQRLLHALEHLPPRCKQAFVLHKIEGRPQAEVAQIMNISLNMVERHIMLGIASCRKALAPDSIQRPTQSTRSAE